MLIMRPNDSPEPVGFFPLFNERLEIEGTQFIYHRKYTVSLPNFTRDEWMFATEIGMSGYKIYYNFDDLDEDALLLQANLAEVLNARTEFQESDKSMLLKYQIRFLMNMVPFMLDHFLMRSFNFSNFLQPVELLDGQSLCDIMLEDPAYLQNKLKDAMTEERERYSLFEFFIKELDEEER